MRKPLIFVAMLTATVTAGLTPASAQFFHFSFGSDRIAPSRVPALVRGLGMEPAGPVFREGPEAYSVQAYDRNGRRVRVVIDSVHGETLAIEPLAGPAQIARAAPPPYEYRGPGVYLDEDEDEPIVRRAPSVLQAMPKPVPKRTESAPPVVAAKPPAASEPVAPRPAVKPVPVPAPVQAAPTKPAAPAVAAKPPASDIVIPIQPAPVVIPPASEIKPPVADAAPAATSPSDKGAVITPLPGGQGVRIVGPASPYSAKVEPAKTTDAPKPATGSAVPPANGLDFD